jgi:hypothetical protein
MAQVARSMTEVSSAPSPAEQDRLCNKGPRNRHTRTGVGNWARVSAHVHVHVCVERAYLQVV